ncbi:hypothetical protein Mal15_52890 [Stieleria maiorica]|uniref:Uncharacterized protein n=1 Tax=Stieleria maiorica TaxID=2795974 RepID=A0A5B9MIM8_9BACT|nr:hypothetical protein Mal15_52890 [Stieleria maiorica]
MPLSTSGWHDHIKLRTRNALPGWLRHTRRSLGCAKSFAFSFVGFWGSYCAKPCWDQPFGASLRASIDAGLYRRCLHRLWCPNVCANRLMSLVYRRLPSASAGRSLTRPAGISACPPAKLRILFPAGQPFGDSLRSDQSAEKVRRTHSSPFPSLLPRSWPRLRYRLPPLFPLFRWTLRNCFPDR